MRRYISLYISVLCIIAASARVIVERIDGTRVVVESPSIVEKGDNDYTLSDVPIWFIKAVYNNEFSQEQDGAQVVLPHEYTKPAAVLDMNVRNKVAEDSENGRYVYSAEYLLQVAGIPYFVTESIDEATNNASFIVLSGTIAKNTFSDVEYDILERWVDDGGILIASAIEHNSPGKCLDLFGVKSVVPKTKDHTIIKWADNGYPELSYIDTDEERNTYIGVNYIFTSSYEPTTAQALAYYDDTQSAAVIKNAIGNGCAYSVGIRWRDVVQRLQLNKGGSNRVKNNHFEPSGDVFPLFVRACYVANNEVAVWKHTIPDGFETVLIPTHDCDSRTALDAMYWTADYEHSLGLNAHYFITTHYFRHPGYMSAFYNEETIPNVASLLRQGHTVGSHSTCHFSDFSKTERFPIVETTPEEYEKNCTYDVDTKTSSGGSTWAEVVMSKQMLERDLGNKVRSFRSGHLCVNKNIPKALVMGDFSFTSCYTSTDLGCTFPFYQRMGVDWTGQLTNVLQMPLSYSDVKPSGETMSEENWQEALDVWTDFYHKLKGNYSPNILLIHPNKEWKMLLQKEFTELLDLSTTGLYNFEDYGDFWIKRLEMDYEYIFDGAKLIVKVKADDLAQYKGQGLFIEAKGPLSAIVITDNSGKAHIARIVKLSEKRLIAVL